MKSKLPKIYKGKAIPEEERQIVEHQEEQVGMPFVPHMIAKQSLFVTFSGIVETAHCPHDHSLIAFCSIVAGSDWQRIAGETYFVSQNATDNGQQIVWNLPFSVTFQTTNLMGWPQLTVCLRGTDFLGRFFVRGYGTVHLPTTAGKCTRTMQLFRPLPQSIISGLFGYLGGCVAQYKHFQQALALAQGREVTRVISAGHLSITLNTLKFNFQHFGYE